jgi:hypothetical protein
VAGVLERTKQNFEVQHGRKIPDAAKPSPKAKTVIRTVKLKNGKTGIEYSDGSQEIR